MGKTQLLSEIGNDLIWLVFWKFLIFPYIVNNTPKWRTHIFQRGWNHQPDLIVTLSLMLQDPPRGQFSGESFRDHVQQGPCMDSVDLVTSILWYKRYIYIVLYIYTYFIFLWCVLYIYIYTFTHTSCVGILYHLFIITYIYIILILSFFLQCIQDLPWITHHAVVPLRRGRYRGGAAVANVSSLAGVGEGESSSLYYPNMVFQGFHYGWWFSRFSKVMIK